MKFISVLLTVLLLLSLAMPAFAAETSAADVPSIHMYGQGAAILNPEGEDIYTIQLPEEGAVNRIKSLIPAFVDAWKLKPKEAWNFYYQEIRKIVLPCFGPFFLDHNGEPSDGTHVDWDWEHGNLPDNRGANGYDYLAYPFHFDWRLDPFENAAILNDYIQDVKKATGSSKVNISARCEAANVLLAYFSQYGYEDLNCAEFFASGGRGVDAVSALFSGKLRFDADAVMRYREQKPEKGTEEQDALTRELVEALLVFSDQALLLDLAAFSMDVFSVVLLYDKVIAPIVLETYGTLPGIWSMVDKEDYADARAGIFKGQEQAYAGLLEKLDRYDRDVRQCADELVRKAVEAGVKVAIFTKYNDAQTIPISKHNNSIGDGLVNVTDASFGASAAKYGKTFSEAYLQKAAQNGTDKYISPDRMIDASTCILPDTTWFIWGSDHKDFPGYIFGYLQRFFDTNGTMTVFDDPLFPQYTIANPSPDDPETGTLECMAQENAPDIAVPESPTLKTVNWKETGLRLLKAIWQFFLRWLKNR